jgi:GT2 family glycosyltransferase
MKGPLRFAVVILNWNGLAHLRRYLPTVLKTNYAEWDCILVDNASTDDSVSWVQSYAGDKVRIIQLTSNEGYTGGYMQGLKEVQADVYILLNSDVEVKADWLSHLSDFMQAYPDAAAVQPKILSDRERDKFEYAGAGGGMVDGLGYPFCAGRIFTDLEADHGQYDKPRQVFWVSGACMVVRSKAFWQCGGLDTRYFAHMEEIDLCWRLQRAGHRLMTCPDSVVYHWGGGSLSYGSPRKTYLNFRNSLFTLTKNLAPEEFLSKVWMRLCLDALAAFYFLGRGSIGDFWAVIKAHWAFLGALPEMLRLRRGSSLPWVPLSRMRGAWSGRIWPYLGLGDSGRRRMAVKLRDFVECQVVKSDQ